MAGKRVSIKYLFFEVCTHDEKKVIAHMAFVNGLQILKNSLWKIA